jgi:Beta-propeller repeat/Abnormal spindle-like microcephaly-assoc'd, ASPM-SPD-2-Hydin
MKSLMPLRYRRALWSTAIAACLVSGLFVVLTKVPAPTPKHVAQGLHSNPAPFRAQPAQPELVEAYGKLPLSFEVNKGQTDSRVKFLSRGGGYSLFLTGNEAVLALRKSNSNGKKQMAKGKNDFQRSPFDAPRALLERPASFQSPVSNFQTPATNNEPRTTDALLRMKLVGANPNPKIVGMDELPGKSNYFIGNDPKKWRTNVPNYAKVKYANVYPGVDLVYYGNQGQLEYDFVVQPGADPRSIQLALVSDEQAGSRQKAVGSKLEAQDRAAEGQSAIDNRKSSMPTTPRVDGNGDLVVGTDGGEVIFHKPVVYQTATYYEPRTKNQEPTTDGQEPRTKNQELVQGKYVVKGNHITFEVARYDKTRPLVIDPELVYSTYLGAFFTHGTPFGANSIAVDASDAAYVSSTTLGLEVGGCEGEVQWIRKLNASGSALLYSTYLGGCDGNTEGGGIAVDASGDAYVTGYTNSCSFPTTPGAFQIALGGSPSACGLSSDVIVTKLSPDGSVLVYSSFVGGSSNDGSSIGPGGEGVDAFIAVDASGNAYVTGSTQSSDFPVTSGAFRTTLGGGLWTFASKLNAAGTALVYSTYLGAIYDPGARGIAVDASGDAYVTGTTYSGFPTTPGAFQTTDAGGGLDAFITKLNGSGSALVYSTYLGGSGDDFGLGIAIDASGNAYVTGYTSSSSDFPTTPDAFQTIYGGGLTDAFVSKLNPSGSALLYSTYLGGNQDEDEFDGQGGIAVDASGNAYVTGSTFSSNFPTTPDALQSAQNGGGDAFITKLKPDGSAGYSTYLGGPSYDNGYGIAVDASGNAYVAGTTSSVRFPITPGAFQVSYGGGGDSSSFVVKISPTDAPGIAFAPGSLSFGPQAVGTTGAPKGVALLDAGSQPLSITSIVARGDFAQTNTCGSAVQPGKQCTVRVTFTPTASGTRAGSITITDNAAGSPHMLLLTGAGTIGGPPEVNLAPASVTFNLLRTVGTTSPPQTVKLTNVGGGQLNINAITVTGADPADFTQTNNCPATVASGVSCIITVTFTPTAQGWRTASISIADSVLGSPQTVPLTGRGTFFEWSPRSMNMGAQKVGTSSAARTVMLTNAGTAPIALFSIQVGGVNAGDFTQTNNCGSSLKAGASCTIEVTFTPTAVGSRLGHVAIQDNAFGGTHWVGLLGKGT